MNKNENLVWKLIDQQISNDEFAELQKMFLQDPNLRTYYQDCLETENTLKNSNSDIFEELVFSPAIKAPKKQNYYTPWLGWVAAILTLAFFLFEQTPESRVTLVAARDMDWRGMSIKVGEKIPSRMLHLKNGIVEMEFPTKTNVIIEAPAFFQVVNNQSIEVGEGSLTITHKGEPGSFSLITPTGVLNDLGTKFGVSIGNSNSQSTVLTHVFEGKVEFNDPTSDKQIIFNDGDYAIIQGRNRGSPTTIIPNDPFAYLIPKKMTFPKISENMVDQNLALNKPVSASGFWSRGQDEIFPPSKINDGRLNDMGTPGNWSFWLLDNNVSGWVTIDLGKPEVVSKLEIQNTHNRGHNDRAAKKVSVKISLDDSNYTQILATELPSTLNQNDSAIPIHLFEISKVRTRYVRITLESFYGNGGGLNEVRIF